MSSRGATKHFLEVEVEKSGSPPPLPILYNTTVEIKIGKNTVGGKKYKEKMQCFRHKLQLRVWQFFPRVRDTCSITLN